MKAQIRRSVFETNSSSTHSLQVVNGGVNKAFDVVWESLKEIYHLNDDAYHPFDETDYIYNNTLFLKGLDFESGSEERCVYYIINNWVAKLQYIAYYIWNEANESLFVYSNFNNKDKTQSWKRFTETELYQVFVREVWNQISKRGLTHIQKIDFCPEYDSWIETTLFGSLTNTHEDLNNLEEFKKNLEIIMDDNYSIIYSDEAYHPYDKHEIYVL